MTAKPDFRRIADDIRARVASGEWKPGHKLPTQAELAAQWKVSVQPVKTAQMILEVEGVLVRRQGKGVFVAGPDDR